jgi:hypothetical protein
MTVYKYGFCTHIYIPTRHDTDSIQPSLRLMCYYLHLKLVRTVEMARFGYHYYACIYNF